jgi:hypothetical protein
MKKLISLAVLLTCFWTRTHAQADEGLVSAGLKLGTNVSHLSAQLSTLKNPDYYMGLNAGAFVRFNLTTKWMIQPELVYSQRGGSFTDNLTGQKVDNRMSYLEVPVLVGYRPVSWLRLHAGPNFQYLVGAEENTLAAAGRIITFRKEALNNLVFGAQLGLGFDISRFSIDLRYDTNLSSLGINQSSADGVSSQTASSRNNVWQLAIGYRLF